MTPFEQALLEKTRKMDVERALEAAPEKLVELRKRTQAALEAAGVSSLIVSLPSGGCCRLVVGRGDVASFGPIQAISTEPATLDGWGRKYMPPGSMAIEPAKSEEYRVLVEIHEELPATLASTADRGMTLSSKPDALPLKESAELLLFVVEQKLLHGRDMTPADWWVAYTKLRESLGLTQDVTYPERPQTKDERVVERIRNRMRDLTYSVVP